MRVYCKEIYKSFTDCNNNVLKGVCLDVASGESLAITGPSGVGKSTLLNLIAGLDDLDSGEIYFDNICFKSYLALKKHLLDSIIFQYIFQNLIFYKTLMS